MRFKHYSLRTEATYREWIKRYIFFHGKRYPREMGRVELERFLSDLAVTRRVAACTQGLGVRSPLDGVRSPNRTHGVARVYTYQTPGIRADP